MSQPDSKSTRPAGILVRRPSTSIYTVMLGITLAALMLGALFLFLELLQYDWFWARPWSQRP